MKKKQAAEKTKKKAGSDDEDDDDDDDLINPNHVKKKMNISELGTRELSRREREQKEKQDAKDKYWKVLSSPSSFPLDSLMNSSSIHSYTCKARPTKPRRIWLVWRRSEQNVKRRRPRGQLRMKVRVIGLLLRCDTDHLHSQGVRGSCEDCSSEDEESTRSHLIHFTIDKQFNVQFTVRIFVLQSQAVHSRYEGPL